MARLILYVPFTRFKEPSGDLRTNAAELENAPLAGFSIGSANIGEVVTVFLGEESGKGNQVKAGDILCVHAHGGDGKYVDVTDNIKETTKLKNLIANLLTLHAEYAAACFFFVCFSAQSKHVADVWKSGYPKQPVFGSDKIAQGGIIYTTRRSIRSSVFTDGRLREL